ncbi:MAG: metalloregulator ArsR/SmtB family transcription factor [Sulfuriferula sp.]|nr:metalloregulator ArsR/SmtB family transcription factor [Sulfuriferula sp.]
MINSDTLFTLLADSTRRLLLAHLLHNGESCVCHLYAALEMSQPKVSRHLAVLREAGLVNAKRSGTWVHYSINPALPDWAKITLAQMATAVTLEAADACDASKTCCAA